jgi:hypothetical protein
VGTAGWSLSEAPGVAGKGQLSDEKRTEKILEGTCMTLLKHGFRREDPTADNGPRTVQAHTRHHDCVANGTHENRMHESEGRARRS